MRHPTSVSSFRGGASEFPLGNVARFGAGAGVDGRDGPVCGRGAAGARWPVAPWTEAPASASAAAVASGRLLRAPRPEGTGPPG
ncbi:hypothetical protein [Sorangium sp. So ce233]|uniref:hypothetical protein n=1 Tax=Sorangium sp. So ce233 TaxID=3133290 RepID=UPI003F632E60